MNNTITTTLNPLLLDFLKKESKKKKVTQKSIIEKGLELYKKYQLEEQVRKGFQSREGEYKNICADLRELQYNSLKD